MKKYTHRVRSKLEWEKPCIWYECKAGPDRDLTTGERIYSHESERQYYVETCDEDFEDEAWFCDSSLTAILSCVRKLAFESLDAAEKSEVYEDMIDAANEISRHASKS